MLKHAWSVALDKLSFEPGSSVMFLHGVIEQFFVSDELPQELPFFRVLTLWWRDDDEPESFVARVQLVAPSGKKVTQSISEEVKFAEYSRYRVGIGVRDAVVEEYGIHRLLVSYADSEDAEDWETVAEIPLIIRDAEEENESKDLAEGD